MTSPAKRKGDRAELECAKYLTENTRFRVARRGLAGQSQDEGDLYGLPGMTVQVCDYKDKSLALRAKPPAADQQAAVISPDTLGVTAIRLRGGDYRFVFTQEAFCKLINRSCL